jgi:hypothetical protein
MTTSLIALVVLVLTIAAVSFVARRFLGTVVVGAISGMAATAIASIIYIAIDYREVSLWPVLVAPTFEGAVLGLLAAASFKLVRPTLRASSFIALGAIGGCLFGLLLGVLFVGHSPHFNHNKAVVVLSLSWSAVALITASTYVLSPNKSLERTRGR